MMDQEWRKKTIIEDKVNTVKVLIAISYLDHILSEKEKSWLTNFIKNVSFPKNKEEELLHAIQNQGESPSFYFQQIQSFNARNKTLNLARYLLCIDTSLSKVGKKTYSQLKSIHEKNSEELIDLQAETAGKILLEHKDQEFYKELEKFGRDLSIHVYPYNILPSFLLTNGKYTHKLFRIIIFLYVCFMTYKFLTIIKKANF